MLHTDSSSDFIDLEKGQIIPLLESEEPESVFDSCPDEILMQIISNLPIAATLALARVNHRFLTLCQESIEKNQQADYRHYRIRLFRHHQNQLNEDIEETYKHKIRATSIMMMICFGGLLTALSSNLIEKEMSTYRIISRDEKILVGVFFATSLAILLSGIASLLYNIKLNVDARSMSAEIDDYEQKIKEEHQALRQLPRPSF